MPGTDFTLTVLGGGPAMPNAGGACAGYLLRFGETSVVVDLGSGVAGRLRAQQRLQDLDAIVISHLHADHHFDLVPVYYGLKFGEPRSPEKGTRTPLYVPPGGRSYLGRLGRVVSGSAAMFQDVYRVAEYSPERALSIGGLTFTFHRVQHYIPSYAMRVRAENGRLLVYSSDVAPCPELIEAARGADLFLCESTLTDRAQDHPDPRQRGHMLAEEAGHAASEASVSRLLLTHLRKDLDSLEAHHRAAASAAFAGPVLLADEGQTHVV